MADDPRHPPPDLSPTTGFFELLRRLEAPELRFGRTGPEPARLGQRVRLSMAARDVAALRPGAPPFVEVEVLGLLGPEGPMPLHLTRWLMQRLSDRWFEGADGGTADTTALDFLNMIQHRLLALYWRAWADQRPEVQAAFGTGRLGAMIDALAGLGLPGPRPARLDGVKRRHATSLASAIQSPARLTDPVACHLGAPTTLREFLPHWMPIPLPLQSRLGRQHARLGRGAVAGARSFQRQTRAELRVGPVDLPLYLRLIEDPALAADLRHLVGVAAPRAVTVGLRPLLRRAAIPAPRLGSVRLGRTLWLAGGRHRDAEDWRRPSLLPSEGEAGC
ncbi:type VI secretion system baseplate subunit TssG [Rhodobacter sphaeroides]|uniref:type VI secretion system baseplate subunit TssG n=1 Tax=Cereibacter sphaeroides TaxID=1063 RepID=UPI00132332DC|nr:type VI secretion system baseplate subunit TssG [Cereibacter sphaeroides]MWP37937.1 type VI secretion system baseplate subunit TssG [Cereibacter sphaeroides]